jgi:GDP-4-dehydro-6-deoxy-D-mannose reductase
MKILVTGATGFAGQHLITELTRHGHDVFGTIMPGEIKPAESKHVRYVTLDITNAHQCRDIAKSCTPDACIHLAGLAHTADTEKTPEKLIEVNVNGTANVAKAMSDITSAYQPKRLLVVSSSFVYGHTQGDPATLRCHETSATSPRGLYGKSKLSAEEAAREFEAKNLSIYVARPFNHIGPGQHASFVIPGFARRILEAANGGRVDVGNLESLRDFSDVRDVVRGYRLIIEIGPSERTFVFGSGQAVKIRDIFDMLCKIAGIQVTPHMRQDWIRANDAGALIADFSLAKRVLGWQPLISLETSLTDIYQDIKQGS